MGTNARRWWVELGVGMGLLLVRCSGQVDPPTPDGSEEIPVVESDAGPTEDLDAGLDAGPTLADGGSDGGADGGKPDAGSPRPPLVLPSLKGWQFYGPAQGGPREVRGVSSDQGGNIWVAGAEEGLFLLTPGATTFRRFTIADGLTTYLDANGVQPQKAISVAGAAAGSVYVGYAGHHGGKDENDPPYMVHSGGADRVVLQPAGIQVTHLEIASQPGEDPHYPAGRFKIRDVFRISVDHSTGDAWFGGNHGIGLWNAPAKRIQEHQHAAIDGYLSGGGYTMLSGDYYGLALDPSGDVWLGGGHRVARLRFSQGRQFWAAMDPWMDIWPDAVERDAHPKDRTDDLVQDLALDSNGTLWVGSIPNGLASVNASGIPSYRTTGMVDRRVTALEVDPKDGSVWVGHIWGGITRISGDQTALYGPSVLGYGLVDIDVPDIQSDTFAGQRRILVAFASGAIGIYTGD